MKYCRLRSLRFKFHVVLVMGFVDEFVADFTALVLFLKNKEPIFLLFLSSLNSCFGRILLL